MTMTAAAGAIADWLREAGRRLAGVSDSPRLDAEILLAHVLAKPRSYLHAWPERRVGEADARRFASLLDRRLAGEPVAYLIGRREFWSLELAVSPATLIPRPETELLVELALARLPADRAIRVADLGAGSGAIALAIARERPQAQVIATDISAAALAVAAANARRLGVANVVLRQGDWCAALAGEHFDAILANPPYIPADDPRLTAGGLAWEPRSALAADEDGLGAIRTIAAQAATHLHPGRWLLVEHGWDQGEPVAALLRAGGFTAVTGYRDLAGCPRVCIGQRRRR